MLNRFRLKGDEGFALAEVVAALVVFAVLFTALIGMQESSVIAQRSNRDRVAATSLATREIEIVTDEFTSSQPGLGPTSIQEGQVVDPDPLPGGTAGQPIVLDNVAFTVTRDAEWESQGATSDPCDGGSASALAYLHVKVSVTWPHMQVGTSPVVDNTALTPPLDTYSGTTGNVKVKVTNSLGANEAGQTVTLTGPSGTQTQQTGSDGCAFFAFLTPGNYTASLGQAGYVDPNWNPTPSSPTLTVTAGGAAKWSDGYDQASTLSLTVPGPSGYPLANETNGSGKNSNGFNVSVYNSNIQIAGQYYTFPLTGSTLTTISHVWPYPNGVTVWAGDCLDADPGYSGWGSGTSDPAPLNTQPGQTVSGNVAAVPVQVTVSDTTTPADIKGVTIIAAHASDSGSAGGCTGTVKDPVTGTSDGEYLTFPTTTSATGVTQALLPYGNWTLEAMIGANPAKVCSSGWVKAPVAPPGATSPGALFPGASGAVQVTVPICN